MNVRDAAMKILDRIVALLMSWNMLSRNTGRIFLVRLLNNYFSFVKIAISK